MFAKSVTVAGKLLTAAVLIASTPAQAQITVPESIYRLFNSVAKMTDGLTTDDRRKYEQAVYSALANLDNGETIKWYSDTSYNHGTVEVVATAQFNGMTCRRIYTSVITQRDQKHIERWGCYNESTRLWEFIK